MDRIVFPNTIRARRLDRGITLAELARIGGITLGHMSRVEAGTRRANADELVAFAAYFGCSVQDLVVDESSSPELRDVWTALAEQRREANIRSGRSSTGLAIEILRKDAKLTLRAIAEVAGMSPARVLQMERGECLMRPEDWSGLASAFAMTEPEFRQRIRELDAAQLLGVAERERVFDEKGRLRPGVMPAVRRVMEIRANADLRDRDEAIAAVSAQVDLVLAALRADQAMGGRETLIETTLHGCEHPLRALGVLVGLQGDVQAAAGSILVIDQSRLAVTGELGLMFFGGQVMLRYVDPDARPAPRVVAILLDMVSPAGVARPGRAVSGIRVPPSS